ncbi:MAG: cupin domain-containing protein [Granulosicoccus sp.]
MNDTSNSSPMIDGDVNSDFSLRVVLHADEIEWEPSPMPGVDRRRLDRVQGEHERVTTIVRYAPDSRFSSHIHGGGEEFIVLEGVFEDDYGDWPAGSYVRNPPTSSHTPGSGPGCTLFVKLWQFDPDDRTFVHSNLNKLGSVPEHGRAGVRVSPLFKNDHEEVRIERWAADAKVTINVPEGAELLVLDGGFSDAHDRLVRHSWLRVPAGGRVDGHAGSEGATVWIKSGHLG